MFTKRLSGVYITGIITAAVLATMALAGYAFASSHFISPDPFTQSELDNDWEADRAFPTDGASSTSAFGRDDVARIGIDSDETAAGTFQRTEGIKTVGDQNFGTAVEVDLYVDEDWEDNATRAGFWVVGDDGAGERDNWFGIVEFVNNEPCPETDCSNQSNITNHEGWRIWDSATGWTNLNTDFTYGEWVTLGIELDTADEEYEYYIDGQMVGTASGGENFIRELFLNSYNYGEDTFPNLGNDSYAAHWHVGLVDEEAPDVEITNPNDGDVVSGTVDIRGTVTDDNPHHYWLVVVDEDNNTVAGPGTVNEDDSFTDESLYSWDTTMEADGIYTIKLEARDAHDNKDSGSKDWIDVEVDNNPDTKDNCKQDGWMDYGFKNQGQCIKFVNTGKDSR